jgi:hypothetical protein
MAEDKQEIVEADAESGEGEMTEAEIDRNLEGTFPASDPPSWTLGTDHHEDLENEVGGDDSEVLQGE